jgi:hypothetical protein
VFLGYVTNVNGHRSNGGNVTLTRRLKPETVAREVAMAEAARGRTPGRWPTIMLDATCTAYCDRLTAAIGSATRPTLPPSRAMSLHHPAPPRSFSSRLPPPSRTVIRRGRSRTPSSMAAAAVDSSCASSKEP